MTTIGTKSEAVKSANGSKRDFKVTASPLALAMADVDRDTAAALLLYRIRWWWEHRRKIGINRDGQRWIAFSIEQWMTDTGLSRDQLKRAMRMLRELNLIVTRPDKVSRRQKFFTTFIRIPDGLNAVATAPEFKSHAVAIGPECTPYAVAIAPEYQGHAVAIAPPTIEIEDDIEIEGDRENAGLQPAPPPAAEREGKKDRRKDGEDSHRGNGRREIYCGGVQGGTLPRMHDAWQIAHDALALPFAKWQPNGKEYGQAKILSLAWGKDAPRVMYECVTRWEDFERHCRPHDRRLDVTGFTKFPSLGTLLTFKDPALQFAHAVADREKRETGRRESDWYESLADAERGLMEERL